MHPSTALSTVLVDELIRCGVRHAVLCPGSRSAPLAYALQEADRAGRLRLHVRVDERSAGFLALGLAKLTRVPAVVVTTSGTAVANLHPAVLEAHHGLVPLIVISADRPPELRGTGANQTTVQPGMFGTGTLRWSHELGVPGTGAGQQAGWRSTVCRATAAALGHQAEAGPVHLDVPLREPLVPSTDPAWPEPLDGRPGGAPWTRSGVVGAAAAADGGPEHVARTLVVVGDLPDPRLVERALDWAHRQGWPVVAEPFGAHPRADVVPHGPLLLSATQWLDDHLPDRVVTVGRVTLSRAVAALLRRPGLRVETLSATRAWTDPAGVVAVVHPTSVLDGPVTGPPDEDWAAAWRRAGAAVAAAVAAEPPPWPSGPAVAATVLGSVPRGSTLFLGSSNAVRDVDLAATSAATAHVVASRGLAGIDGCVSTAVGLALSGEQPTYALLGDLTFLHDANAMLIGPDEPRPDLTVVVTNDDGGGIFSLLEPGEPERAADFERIFGTPTGTDLAALCAAHRVEHLRVDTGEALADALTAPPQGLRVVEVRVPRGSHRAVHARLRQVAADALR